jgi:hypothetical protein
MSKAKVDRKNLHDVEGKKPPAPRPNRAEELPNANGSSHGQRSTPTSPGVAELTIAMLFWPLDVYDFVVACTDRILIANDARHGPSYHSSNTHRLRRGGISRPTDTARY